MGNYANQHAGINALLSLLTVLIWESFASLIFFIHLVYMFVFVCHILLLAAFALT